MSAGTIQLIAIPPDFYQKVGEGAVVGYSSITRVGFNPAVGVTEEVISGLGGAAPFMPSAATQVEAVSASADDTAAGTGARSILITGLDANFNEIVEVITLNGVTPVASLQSFIRVYSLIALTCGTYRGSNAGDVTLRVVGAGADILLMFAGQGQALTTHFCVPAGKTMFIRWFFTAVEGNKNVSLNFWVGTGADIVAAPFSPIRSAGRAGGLSSAFDQDFGGLTGGVPEKTDVWLSGLVAATTAAVTAEYSYILKNN